MVSIRAPAWGATQLIPPLTSGSASFNPRSRVGSDLLQEKDTAIELVSIRAPAWGATWAFATIVIGYYGFQSALPRGERPSHTGRYCPSSPVSIRAPAWGATVDLWRVCKQADVSIRAPAWGATADLPKR